MSPSSFLSKGRDYWVLSAFMFSLFVSYAFVYAMYAIWLSQGTELTGEQIGIVFSINSLAALLIQPLLGVIQDKIQARQHLLWLNVCTLLGSGPFFNYVYQPLLLQDFWFGAAIGALYVALVFLAIAGAIETYIERISRFNGLEFGQVRTWGSLGWGTAAFFTGQLINVDPGLNFWAASATALVPLCILLVVKVPVSQTATQAFASANTLNSSDLFRVVLLPNFRRFVLFVVGVASVYVIYDQQFPVYFSSVFPTPEAGNRMYGYLNSTQIYLEAAGFFVAPALVNRVGAKNGLLLAGLLMVLRILGSGLTDDPVVISLIKLIHAAELPILMVAVFKYLNQHFEPHMSSTLFLVGFAFVTQVGTILLSPLVGKGYDMLGFQSTYLILAGVAGCFLALSALLLESDNVRSQGVAATESVAP